MLLWLSQIFTQSAVSIISIILAILSHEGSIEEGTGGSATSIGIIVNLTTLPGLVIAPIAGVFADRFCKKRIIILSILARIIFLFGFVLY